MDLNVSSNLITRKYFGFATCDPTVLHSAMGIAALMWSIALPDRKAAYKEGCKQKALTIPSIQERLQANDMSSAVVGAIANLAQMEVRRHSPRRRVAIERASELTFLLPDH